MQPAHLSGPGARVSRVALTAAPACHLQGGVEGACCTLGQPTYNGQQMNFVGFPTCSDGPCSGKTAAGTPFSYFAVGGIQSAEPDACCDPDQHAVSGFFWNPTKGKADDNGNLLMWPVSKSFTNFPKKTAGTGLTCDPLKLAFRCGLTGQESNDSTKSTTNKHRHLLKRLY